MSKQYELEPYQEKFVKKIKEKLLHHKSIIAQLCTGAGKTVVFAAITNEFINNHEKDVIIFVHRKELLNQTEKTFNDWYDIKAQKIDVNNHSYLPNIRVYIAMVNTFDRRINNDRVNRRLFERMQNVGLVIVDEAHRNEFTKIFDYFKSAKRIGFTATPISAKIKDPLKDHYDSIVVGCSIEELIKLNKIKPDRGVVPDATFKLDLDTFDRSKLIDDLTGAEFDLEKMGEELSSPKQINNTIAAYAQYAYNKKMLCFNANKKHSKLVTDAMVNKGLLARHLDSDATDDYRKDCLDWLKNTDGAILCNVGIFNTGFDEPSVQGVIINKATKSFTLYKQMCGRSARAYDYKNGKFKTEHIILDLGDNVSCFGLWSEDTDWEDIFNNPEKPKNGKAPVKSCPECRFVNPASIRVCKHCGFIFPNESAKEDKYEREMIRVTKDIILMEYFKDRHEYFSFFKLIKEIAKSIRYDVLDNNIDEYTLGKWCEITYSKIREWIVSNGKIDHESYQIGIKYKLIKELKDLGFEIENTDLTVEQANFSMDLFSNYSFDTSGKVRNTITEEDIIISKDEIILLSDKGEEHKFEIKDIIDFGKIIKMNEMQNILDEAIAALQIRREKIEFLKADIGHAQKGMGNALLSKEDRHKMMDRYDAKQVELIVYTEGNEDYTQEQIAAKNEVAILTQEQQKVTKKLNEAIERKRLLFQEQVFFASNTRKSNELGINANANIPKNGNKKDIVWSACENWIKSDKNIYKLTWDKISVKDLFINIKEVPEIKARLESGKTKGAIDRDIRECIDYNRGK